MLYGISKGDKIKVWTIAVADIDGVFTIVRTHGYKDGKMTLSHKEIREGKNIGKKNETTPKEQAIRVARSMWDAQKASGYSESKEPTPLFLPMLAHDYKKRGKDIKFPCYAQPKIDGVRLVSTRHGSEDGSVRFFSRTGKPINITDGIKTAVEQLIPIGSNMYIDGELFSPDLTFEEISGISRRLVSGNSAGSKADAIRYWVFDCYNPDVPDETFAKRFCKTQWESGTKLVFCPTLMIDEASRVDDQHQKYIQEGYEGIMLRNADSRYVPNFRSKDLQKLKSFKDKEFEIISGKEAEGLDAGTVILQCKDHASQTFWVRPRGTREYRRGLLERLNEILGKKLTVRYQNLTDCGVPRFPVGVAIRDYE